uniref:Uncharacterized protein n=1 Tax=Rhizophora mucronata TaxID=61149 RepID=A0A2P2Q280_RHIMU
MEVFRCNYALKLSK